MSKFPTSYAKIHALFCALVLIGCGESSLDLPSFPSEEASSSSQLAPVEPSSSSAKLVFCRLSDGSCAELESSVCLDLVGKGVASVVSVCESQVSSSSSEAVPLEPSSSSVILVSCQLVDGNCVELETSTCLDLVSKSMATLVSMCGVQTFSSSSNESNLRLSSSSVSMNDFEIFIDARDQQEYPYLVVGGLLWMKYNLNYSDNGIVGACYGDTEAGCEDGYGRHYTWDEVLTYSLCPSGWRLPTADEVRKIAFGCSDECLWSNGTYSSQDAVNFMTGGNYNTNSSYPPLGWKDREEPQNHGFYWTADESYIVVDSYNSVYEVQQTEVQTGDQGRMSIKCVTDSNGI
jgi:uncharacterized protein (TIGR02145 family)